MTDENRRFFRREVLRTKYSFVRAAFGFLLLTLGSFPIGCGSPPSPPADFQTVSRTPKIYPDYNEIVVPENIAPLNFEIQEEGDLFLTQISSAAGIERVFQGRTLDIPLDFWKNLLANPQTESVRFVVFARNQGKWSKFDPIVQTVSRDPIDPWVSYRLVEPGYEFYHRLGLYQRRLETFEEKAFFQNESVHIKTCVNCHSFQDRKTDRFLFHTRNQEGGTTFVQNGKAVKIDTKNDALNSACVYPSWRPTGPFVAFSVNNTFQFFHSKSPQKIDVLDSYSDLVLYDCDKNTIFPIFRTPDVFETFPSWSQDGRWLYYCAAELKLSRPLGDDERIGELREKYKDLKYNLMRISFDETDRTFGDPETVVDAAAIGKSVVHPRLSPDGKTLMYTLSQYGTFPIWNQESDLWIRSMETGETRPLTEVNSDRAESWHNWDSSGRWFVFSSRRDDGSFTRLYFAHFDENGRASKPFLLPQKDPRQNGERMKSYNIPELTVEPIKIPKSELVRAVKTAFPPKAEYSAQ